MDKLKGITPILAVVLLVVVTTSSVLVLFSSLQSDFLNGNSNELSFQEIQNTALDIESVSSDEDHMILYVTNSGDRSINTSKFSLRFQNEKQGSSVSYQEFGQIRPDIVRKGQVYTFLQDGKEYFIRPYSGSVSGSEWYPDTNQKLEDSPIENAQDSFAVTIYRDNSQNKEYLVFSNQNSNVFGRAKIDLKNMPNGSIVVHSDGKNGEGPVPHNHDELSLQHEPEGNWGYYTRPGCCYDGGVIELPKIWSNFTVNPVDVGPNLRLYEQYDGSYDVNDTKPIVVRRFEGNQCFKEADKSEIIEPGEKYSCFTGLRMPTFESILLEVNLRGTEKNWEYKCDPVRDVPVC